MAAMSYAPAAMRAYLAGRQLAHLMSVDAATASVPAEHAGEAEAYRQGIVDEQADAPLPTQQKETSSDPPKPAASPVPARVTAKERRLQQLKAFLFTLKAQPVETIRAVAEAQILRIEKAFKEDAPYFTRTYQPDYAGIKDRLAGARANLAAGDQLRGKADEASKVERRNSYLRAYTTAFTEGENLASTVGDESFLILTLANVVIPAAVAVGATVADAGKAALQAGKDVVGEVGKTARTVGYVLAGGAALALIAFASQRGKRR